MARTAQAVCLILVLAAASAGHGVEPQSAATAAEGNAQRGRELAATHCARCHVVGDLNPFGGIGSTPSFQLLARRADYLERFSTFYERRPHPVFVRVPGVERWTSLPSHVVEFTIQPEDLADLIAFVSRLRAAQ